MSEIKTPQAGEWWETRSGERAYVAASLHAAGKIPYSEHSELTGWSMAGGSISGRSWSRNGQWFAGCDGEHDLVKHLPDCTGWDWKEPDWVELDHVNYGWHVLRAGVDYLKSNLCDVWDRIGATSCYTGTRISECDRLVRCLSKDLPIKPPEPAIASCSPYVVSLDTYEKVVAERNALQDRLREIEAKAKF